MLLRSLRGRFTPLGRGGSFPPTSLPRQTLAGISLPPLLASLLLVSAGVGAFVLIAMATLALVPLLFVAGLGAALVLAGLLCAWAGVEGLAALERWMESDSRFRR